MLTVAQANDVITMTAVLVTGGLSNGLVQPASGSLIAVRAPRHRHSLAAGMIGAALGAGTLVPGLLVALVLPAYGWRAAMAIAGLVALIPAALTPLARIPPGASPARADQAVAAPGAGRVLVLWALAAAFVRPETMRWPRTSSNSGPTPDDRHRDSA